MLSLRGVTSVACRCPSIRTRAVFLKEECFSSRAKSDSGQRGRRRRRRHHETTSKTLASTRLTLESACPRLMLPTRCFSSYAHDARHRRSNRHIHEKQERLHPHLSSYLPIRSCESQIHQQPQRQNPYKDNYDDNSTIPVQEIDTGFHVAFLGTGGSQPSPFRNTSATALRLTGSSSTFKVSSTAGVKSSSRRSSVLLFDAGEGVQRHLMQSTLSVGDITHIYITHMHADHVMGLPGILLNMQAAHKQALSGLEEKHKTKATHSRQPHRDTLKKNKKKDRSLRRHKVQIYGPPGLYHYIATTMLFTCAKCDALDIIVHELAGSSQEEGCLAHYGLHNYNCQHEMQQIRSTTPNSTAFLPPLDVLAQALPHVQRIAIPMQPDGTWILQQSRYASMQDMALETYKKKMIREKSRRLRQNKAAAAVSPSATVRAMSSASRHASSTFQRDPSHEKNHSKNNDNTITDQQQRQQNYELTNGLTVTAAELQHVRGVPTFGYVVTEPTPSAAIDPSKAMDCGVRPGPKYELLKHGISVPRDDVEDGEESESNMVHPHQVLKEEGRNKGRKFVILGDHCDPRLHEPRYFYRNEGDIMKGRERTLSPMAKLAMDADVLVHEAGASHRDERDARRRGHCSSTMAGRVARNLRAKAMMLNHIGTGWQHRAAEEVIEQEALRANAGSPRGRPVTRIGVARDFMELLVPRFGF